MHQAVTAQARLLGPLADRCDEPELAAQWRAFVNDRGDGWTHYDGTVVASARNHEGLAARAAGDLGRAADAHHAALEWYTSAGIPTGVAFTESCLGFLAAERGRPRRRGRHHAAALAAAVDVDDPAALALALEGRAADHRATRRTAPTLLGAADRFWPAAAPSTARRTAPTSRRSPTPPAWRPRGRRVRRRVRRGRRASTAAVLTLARRCRASELRVVSRGMPGRRRGSGPRTAGASRRLTTIRRARSRNSGRPRGPPRRCVEVVVG